MRHPYVAAWEKFMGSRPYYRDEQLRIAAEDNAPTNAIYKREDGWQTVDNISNEQTKHAIEQIAKQYKDK